MLGFGLEGDEWEDHFFERDAAVLEGVGVAVEVVVAVVFVEEEVVFESEDEFVGDAGFGETDGVDGA